MSGPPALPETVIAFTVSGLREKYLSASLGSWAKVRGIKGVRLLFMVEPTMMDVAAFTGFLDRNFPGSTVVLNDDRLGCLENTKAAVDKAFSLGAQFIILAEEDLEVSDDVLEYFTFTQKYAHDENIIAACAHTFQASPKSPADGVVSARWFSPLVWGTWRSQWEKFIRPEWDGLTGNPQAWDLQLRLRIVHGGKWCVFPGRSRAIHRGIASTLTVAVLAEHFYRASLSNCFSPHYGVQDWHEVPRSKEYGLVVLWLASTGQAVHLIPGKRKGSGASCTRPSLLRDSSMMWRPGACGATSGMASAGQPWRSWWLLPRMSP